MDTFNLRNFLKGKNIKESFGNDIENYISIIGYDTYDQFFEDNPGAVQAMEEFLFTVPEFRKQLTMQGYEDVANMYEAKFQFESKDEKEELTEGIDGEGVRRANDLVPEPQMKEMLENAMDVFDALEEDGFDHADILDYMMLKIEQAIGPRE